MSLAAKFRPAVTIQHAASRVDFIKIAQQSPKNASLIAGDQNGPHKFIYMDAETGPKEFFFVQEPDGEISAIAITYRSEPNSPDMRLMGVSVHPGYRGRGYSKSLVRSMLSKAQEEGRTFIVSDFTYLGWNYLSPSFIELHRDFPNVRIKYNALDESVSGFSSYRLEQDQGITRVIEL